MRATIPTLAAACLAAIAAPTWSQTPQSNLWVTNGPVLALAASGSTLYLGGYFTRIGPPTGSYLALSNTTGAIVGANPSVVGTVSASIPDGSGGRFIAGNFTYVQGQPHNNVAHLDANGNVLAWNPGTFNADIRTLAIDYSNPAVLYLGGIFSLVNGSPHSVVAAVDIATGTVTAWDPQVQGYVNAIAALNGVIYFGGSFSTVGGQTRHNIAAVNGAGTLLGWDPDCNNIVNTIVPFTLPAPFYTLTVFIGGSFTSVHSQARYAIAAIDANGVPTAWSPNGDHAVLTIALAVTNRGFVSAVYAGGTFDNIGAWPRQHLALLDPSTGTASTSWVPEPDGPVNSILLDGNTVYVGGAFGTIAGATRHCLAALDATTGAATPWDPNPNDEVKTVAWGSGVVYTGGYFTSLGGVLRTNLAAVNTASGAATAWNPGADGPVWALAVRGNTIYAGGQFSQVGNPPQPRQNIAAIDAGGSATGWMPNANSTVYALTIKNDTLYAGGAFLYMGGETHNLVASFDLTTGALTGWNPNLGGYGVHALVVEGPRVYLGGDIEWAGPYETTGLCAATTTGFAIPCNPNLRYPVYGPYPTVFAMAVKGTSVIAGGDFTVASQVDRHFLAEFDGFALDDWNPSPEFFVRSLLLSGNTVFIGGVFAHLDGVPRSNIAAVDFSSHSVLPWDPNASDAIGALALVGSTVYAGGDFLGMGGWPHSHLAGIIGGVTAVGDAVSHPARALQLSANPSRGALGLRFTLPVAADAEVGIFDVSGRQLRRIDSGVLSAGDHELTWNGRDDAGNVVSAGVYFVRVHAGTLDLNAKAVRLK